eukprot:CAMPEP_0117002824 /NCGR_PEP_ID=MMETSP0472-20121206/4357_1 /TAXON_ID=693140 ORGANISM="Tiarina fusus, Strain LIS" /NCGR_SAMPLE_ID=MMETSP0472 /ASSEMBLY_ACC=CAM_ASM_000603 /LENGTH=232 /DNA_ID=CAMNT_0004703285 /DNA_START=1 /DNA_END=700 /DNA_ORIENTATION=+
MKCSSDGCDNYANSENEGNVCNKCFYNWKPFGPNYEYKPTFPLPWEDNRAKKECVEISPIIHKEMASRCGVADEDDLTQYYDSEEILREKAKVMADAIRECKHMVAYSGAGISVSAGIGDFRGPNGCWTLKARGLPTTKSKSVEELKPTFAHRALVELLKVGKLKCVITTNYDALHEKSGIRMIHFVNFMEMHMLNVVKFVSMNIIEKNQSKKFLDQDIPVDCVNRLVVVVN